LVTLNARDVCSLSSETPSSETPSSETPSSDIPSAPPPRNEPTKSSFGSSESGTDRRPGSSTETEIKSGCDAHDHANGHSHGHGHSHGLTRGEEVAGVSDAGLIWAFLINQLLTVVQVVAGLFSGSVSLLSDAAHNFSDANALLIAYIARRISRRKSNMQYTFGYRRAEMVGALINLTLLAIVGLYLVYEGLVRFIDPHPIMGWLMGAAAVVALIVDVATAGLLWTMSQGSINVRAAFVHNIVDALGSLAVLVGAALILIFDWVWVDSVLTLLIAAYILYQVAKLFPQATRILMQAAPLHFEIPKLVESVESIPDVQSLHHIHVWQLDEHANSMEAHVTVETADVGRWEAIKREIKQCLASDFNIHHSTLEFEFEGNSETACADQSIIANC
jgi:cobalt-zinc-cadmium efflux system protein